MAYKYLSKDLSDQIESDRASGKLPKTAFDENHVLRRDLNRDNATVLRTAFIRDIDKIMHCLGF